MRRAKLRRFLGTGYFPRMLELMRLDVRYSNNDFATWQFLKDAFESFKAEPVLPEPLVRGRDLVAWGVEPGPEMGAWLHELYDEQLEGRLTSLDAAKEAVRQGRRRPASCGDA